METPSSKDGGKKKPAMTALQKAMLAEATEAQLRSIRASINSRLRASHGGGRPKKKRGSKAKKNT